MVLKKIEVENVAAPELGGSRMQLPLARVKTRVGLLPGSDSHDSAMAILMR